MRLIACRLLTTASLVVSSQLIASSQVVKHGKPPRKRHALTERLEGRADQLPAPVARPRAGAWATNVFASISMY